MPSTEILFLGTDSVTPGPGDDTISFILNRTILVDTGWCAALRMLDHGLNPTDLRYLFFTHLHHDHYVGLPQILFYRWMKGRGKEGMGPLTILGPAKDVCRVVQLAKDLLQAETFDHRPAVEIRPLEPGDGYETDAWQVTTAATVHPVQGLCYRFCDKVSGAEIAFTGDTAPHPPLVDHVRGADLLIHEASHGAESMAAKENKAGHSGAPDAARIALEAEVRRLALVHGPGPTREQSVEAAKAIFPNVFWPQPGETVTVARE